MRNNDKTKEIGFIDNQNTLINLPYGSRGNVADNGCGSIACYNLLHYFGYIISYHAIHDYFNDNRRVIFRGRWGTNPLSIKKYLNKKHNIRVKMHFGIIPDESYDAYIVMNIYKTKKSVSAHYVFGYFEAGRFITYNLNHNYDDLKEYIKKNDTVGKLFVVYGINK